MIRFKHYTGTKHDQNQWVHAGGRGTAFNMIRWEAKSIPDRAAEWKAMSVADRDKLTEAEASIKRVQKARLSFAGKRPTKGTSEEVTKKRLAQIGDFIQPDATERISTHMNQLSSFLKDAGVDDATSRDLILEAIDSLAVQENESYSRTLGDHGTRHVLGNMDYALQILDAVPGADSVEAKAAVSLAAIFHDTGYLTGPSQIFLDEGHPRWSKQHYNENLRPLVEKALGREWAEYMSDMIVSHADSAVDWESDPVASSLRLADNLALFQKEKLPPVFTYAPKTVDILKDLATKKVDLKTAQESMLREIDKVEASDSVKESLQRSVKELNPVTPKFTLGMLAGDIGKIYWNDGRLVVQLNRNANAAELQKIMDLGQRQFIKFAESYGIDLKDKDMDTLDIGGKVLISIGGPKLKEIRLK